MDAREAAAPRDCVNELQSAELDPCPIDQSVSAAFPASINVEAYLLATVSVTGARLSPLRRWFSTTITLVQVCVEDSTMYDVDLGLPPLPPPLPSLTLHPMCDL